MTATSCHRLEGLEPDNLLAFLTLLGLLRALELTRPNWRPRAYYDLEANPLRPVLTTQREATRDEISEAALEGLLIFRDALWPFSWPRSKQEDSEQVKKKNKKIKKKNSLFLKRSRQRALSKRCTSAVGACVPNSKRRLVWQLRCDLIACSGAGANGPSSEKDIEPSPLKLPSGQMAFIGAQFDLISRCNLKAISACLFETWTYSFKGSSLRFSPNEAQRYAYRASDPSPEGSRTELGASALSGLGLLAFVMSDAEPQWRMVAYAGTRKEGTIMWPIWGAHGGAGSSLDTILAMLRSITLGAKPNSYIVSLVGMLATARRYVLDTQGDYGNISRAKLAFPHEELLRFNRD